MPDPPLTTTSFCLDPVCMGQEHPLAPPLLVLLRELRKQSRDPFAYTSEGGVQSRTALGAETNPKGTTGNACRGSRVQGDSHHGAGAAATLLLSRLLLCLRRYVFCRQRQDESLRRGGEQVSVLVLAATPFSGALLPLSQAAGHAFFNEGPLALTLVSEEGP